jgi:hypothetical protein
MNLNFFKIFFSQNYLTYIGWYGLFRSGNLILPLLPCNLKTGGLAVTAGLFVWVVLEKSAGRRNINSEATANDVRAIVLTAVEYRA